VVLAPHFAGLPWRQRFLLGYASGDMTAALFLQKYPSEAPQRGKVSFLKALMYPNWIAWQVGSIAGIFLGSAVPSEWGLGFAGTLAIICIMVPLTASRPAVCGVLVAGAVAVAGAGLPYKLGLLAAVVVGMLTAMAVEELTDKRKADKLKADKHG
jgi:predicted branched-subunit amino acid permease